VSAVIERKPTPEQLLQQLQSEEEHQARGRLKVFFGYASGVGKSFRMLDEGRRRHERGQDVIVGAIQPRLSPDLQAIAGTMDVIPLKTVNNVTAMDLEAILERRPKVCLVDGLAYDNPPGFPHERRWQDVEQLLDAGISVITSVNLQHIEEMRPRVESITGKHISQTVPLSFIQTADEIVVVDVAPESCKAVADDGSTVKANLLSQNQLSELRELALLLAADVVDKQLGRYLERNGIEQSWGTQERILVWLSPSADAPRMLESGARNRDRFHGELIAAHMNRPDWSPDQRAHVMNSVDYAKAKNAEIVALTGDDFVDAILSFARQRGITQIYVGHKGRESWWDRAFGSDLERLISLAEGIDVRVFPHA
jgi:two-component system, OmpR family, sensor histidine kinase KdpD